MKGLAHLNTVPLGRARWRALLVVSFAAVSGVLASPAAFAATEAPGWALTARTFPTNLVKPVNEVQEVAVDATGGTFTLTFQGTETAPIAAEAPAASVQDALESVTGVGVGGVAVMGGPGGAGATAPYVVTFTGHLGGRAVPQLEANGSALTGGAQTATVTTRTKGAGSGTIVVKVYNVGAAASKGTITVTDTLPEGLIATEAGGILALHLGDSGGLSPKIGHEQWACTGNGPGNAVTGATVVTCTNLFAQFAGGGGAPTGDFASGPTLQPRIAIAVHASGEAAGLVNHVTIAGGGAHTPASAENPVTVSSERPRFGFVGWDAWFSNADGTIDTRAGSHPYEATFNLDLAEDIRRDAKGEVTGAAPAGGSVRDIEVRLPPGLVVNPTAVPQCTRSQLDSVECPQASEVGIVTPYFAQLGELGFPLFNMVPPPGLPAELGFNFNGILNFIDGGVRSGSDYGITSHINQVSQREIAGSVVTLWNVPGEASHSLWRNGELGGCTQEESEHGGAGPAEDCPSPRAPILKPFLTLPTACSGPLPFSIRANTWQNINLTSQAEFLLHDSNGTPTGITGCERLGFGPLITTSPDTARADTPAGLTVEVKPSVGGLEEQNQLGTADIQNTTVTLPEGFVINPGQAAGLQACQPSQDGLTSDAEKAKGEENNDPAKCPSASKVGTVTIKSPLIEGAAEKQFEGSVYVLQSNPPEIKLLVAASADGVNLKLVGVVHLNEQTGQLTTKFDGTPELPFTVFKLSFSGGAQAALDTPTQCGAYETTADFTPWSSPLLPDFLTNAAFSITEGPGGGPCPSSPLPFAPSLTAGSTTDQAGGFTNFSLLLQRGDGQQRIEKLQFKEPPGLAGLLSQVPLCPEPQAAQGTCSAASHIGHSVVTSGPGPYPLVIPQPGEPEAPIYLTGSYEGAPFGLSIVTPVIAGPFNLGTIVTRAKIEVDPHTAQITITTDPLPQIVKGVPTDLREINAIIDRSGFLFNPTNCTPQEFTGTATSAQGVTAAIASHFGVGSCRSLAFKPRFSASASGKNSKAGGAGLDVKVAYPSEPQGSEANIAKVKVDLPKQLPSRLTTLQKACTAAQFDANPAGCPAASVVGHAIVHTSVLPVPLEGPAYFVSNGGEAFPNLIMVLQGYGVTVDLVGDTFINKAGITSSTFKSVPDVPFNTFELTLPQGPNSALATNVPAKAQYSLCGQKLTMPTELVAQNGAVIVQATPIGIASCAKTKALTRAQKLARALRACHRKPKGRKRVACERTARKRFGPVKAKQKRKR
jgi:hypothetical protein